MNFDYTNGKALNIYRLENGADEIEAIPPVAVTYFLDVRTAFRRRQETISGELFTDSAEDEAFEEVSNGATLFTEGAVYSRSRKVLEEIAAQNRHCPAGGGGVRDEAASLSYRAREGAVKTIQG
jgi:hypothetical protein